MKPLRTTLAIFFIFTMTTALGQDAYRAVEISVVDGAGEPLADATIDVATADMEFPLAVDDKGRATLNFPVQAASLTLRARCSAYVPLEVYWKKVNVPTSFTFEMAQGQPIGGLVHDERGQPIEGVLVQGVAVSSHVAEEGEVNPAVGGELGTTDATGRWQVNIASDEPFELRIKLSHNDFFSDRSFGKRRLSNEQLRGMKHVEVLADRIPPQGIVVDEAGKPVEGAAVYVLDGTTPLTLINGQPMGETDELRVVTDSQGAYQFAEQEGSFVALWLAEAGWSMVPSKRYTKNQPVEVNLTPWATLRGALTDDGKACASDKLQLLVQDVEELRGNRYVVWNNFATTNEKGEFEFKRLTNGYAMLGQCIEYCGSTPQQQQDFSNEFQISLAPGENATLSCTRKGVTVTGTVVPLRYDDSEAAIHCGMIVLTKEDDATDIVKNLFFEWGKASTVGMQLDPVENAVWMGERPHLSYLGRVEADGTFRIEHVPPGSYRARVRVWCGDADTAALADEYETGWHEGAIWEALSVKPEDSKRSVALGLLEFEVYESEE